MVKIGLLEQFTSNWRKLVCIEQLQAQWAKPCMSIHAWVTAWPIFSAICGKTACHTCCSLHAIYGCILDSSGTRVDVTVFPCEIWAADRSQLPSLQRTGRAAVAAAVARPARSHPPHAQPTFGTCLAAVRPHALAVSPHAPCFGGRRWEGGLCRDSEVPRSPTSQMPDVGPGGRSPLVPFCILLCGVEPCRAQKFTLQVKPNQNMCPRRTPSAFLLAGMQSVGQVRAGGGTPNSRSCGHEVLSNVWLCRPAPVALYRLLTPLLRGSSPRAHVPHMGDNHCLI